MEVSRNFKLSRSHHILLSSELTSECSRIGGYQRLTEEHDFIDQHLKLKRGIGLFGKVFSLTRISSSSHKVPDNKMVMKKQNKRSSWLPDPQNRWPIQGW
ncbi:hypothetical protein Lal_00027400 [Lupinus albus]|uniref:Uncharacterized protein n=1 Tax=Lupinus albus TaxID=3870 RepID=A0A6A4QIE0_LUPAL|nr:hypothetical protein Lalb_Chr05g0212791 [Lupinus albus]KAF1873362.1 hypothetical protein Lal_00027400 [Lupinus albus]